MKLRNLLFTALLMVIPFIAFAQYSDDISDEAAGCLGCGFVVFWIIGGLAWLGLSIWATIWVNKDAKARGMENASLFLVLMIIGIFVGFWWIVWIVYLITRPKDNSKTMTTTSIPPPPPNQYSDNKGIKEEGSNKEPPRE